MMEKDLKDNVFKKEIKQDVERVYDLYTQDPLVLATLLYKLLEERENTNRIMKTLLNKIEKLEAKIEQLEGKKEEVEEEFLPEQDVKIIEFLKERGKATAKDVAEYMGYKGVNAASARLNRLEKLGMLLKRRVGKKIYFLIRQGDQ